jgi:hypothetical protein
MGSESLRARLDLLAIATCLGLLALLGGVGPAPAAAAPAWLAPVDLSAPGQDATEPAVVADFSGGVAAVWSRDDGSHTVIQSASRPAGGAWSPAVDLSAAGGDATEPRIAVDSLGDLTAVWSRSDGSHTIIQSSSRPAGGAWSSPLDLSAPGRDASEPQLAAGPGGDVAAVWRRFDGFDQRVQAAIRPHDGAWPPAIDISAAGENAGEPRVAFGPAVAVAVWSRLGSSTVIQSSSGSPGGGWTPAGDVSEGGAEEPEVAVDAAGGATAVWSRLDGSDLIVQGAGAQAGGPWSAPLDLSEPGRDATEPALAVDAAGDATAVWSRLTTGSFSVVQSSSRPAGGAWSQAVNLSPDEMSTAVEPEVSAAPTGGEVAVWARSVGAPTVIESASAPGAGGWTSPIGLSVLGRSADEPALGIDPTGDGIVAWSREDGAHTIVQAAGRDAAGPQLRSLSIPSVGNVNRPVAFSVAPFDVWSAIGPISWTFGDGAAAAGAAVKHTFGWPGTYTVTMTAADSLGNSSGAIRRIEIFNKASAGRNVRARGGRALLRLRCPSPVGCTGLARLIARIESKQGGRTIGRRVQIGREAFSIPGPATTTVPVPLTRKGRAQLGRSGRAGLRTQLTGPGVKHRVVLLLKPAR